MRYRFKMKLTSEKGETMAESLFSILIIALATSMFLNFIIISGRIMDRAKEREKKIHTATAMLEEIEDDIWEEAEFIDKSEEEELIVSVKSKNGKTIAKDHFTVDVYYSPYGAVYR
ncbi:MAG: hypothetical protein HFG66_10335 [Hungatella sp.]|nr:hypothetical protein [Hungatella sp.]